jgi:hypothetical protein
MTISQLWKRDLSSPALCGHLIKRGYLFLDGREPERQLIHVARTFGAFSLQFLFNKIVSGGCCYLIP